VVGLHTGRSDDEYQFFNQGASRSTITLATVNAIGTNLQMLAIIVLSVWIRVILSRVFHALICRSAVPHISPSDPCAAKVIGSAPQTKIVYSTVTSVNSSRVLSE
jgi:hypothetical protein